MNDGSSICQACIIKCKFFNGAKSRGVKDFRHETKRIITGNNFSRSRFSRCCSYDKRRRLFVNPRDRTATNLCKPSLLSLRDRDGEYSMVLESLCLIFQSQWNLKRGEGKKKKEKENEKYSEKRKRARIVEKRKVYHRGKRKRFTMQRDSLISSVVRYVSVTDVHTGICTPIEFRFYAF